MDRKLLEESFITSIKKNFNPYSKYFEYQYKVFFELTPSVFEVLKCEILEFHNASITLTNNILERLLKLALINNEVGIGSIPIENWNSVFKEVDKKYGSLPLGNSIECCRKHELITENEKNFLFDTIRELMRNGFAHADSNKILAGLPDETTMFQASFSNPKDLKKVILNQKTIPILQSIQIENFAKANSSIYFQYVFDLLIKIELRLIEKSKSTCT